MLQKAGGNRVSVRFGPTRQRPQRCVLPTRQAAGLALALGIAGSSSATGIASKDGDFAPRGTLLARTTFSERLGEARAQQSKQTRGEKHFAQQASEPEAQQGDLENLPVQVGDALLVTGDGVNVRSEPNTGAGIRTQLYRGDPVTALERRGVWVRVALGGTGGLEGWIHGSLLEHPGGERLAAESDREQAPQVAETAPAAGPATGPAAASTPAIPEAKPASPTPAPRPEVESRSPSPAPEEQQAGAATVQQGQPQPRSPAVVAQQQPAPTSNQPVGEAPPEDEPAQVPVSGLREIGGVLTPKGTVVLEPVLRLSHSEVDRFTFRGVELIETVLVGVIEAEESDRNLIEASLTTRLGITDRLEIEARLPGLYRNDEVSTTLPDVPGDDAETRETSLDAFGIGDVEAAVHYQINSGGPDMPIFVGNLRGKFPTGQGPFDVERDEFGIEEESPTGSGFFGLEPSLTVLYRSDPVVFYANGGYLINFKRDVDEQIGVGENAFQVGVVDPGDAIRIGFGMGFAVNESTSFSLGYSHDFIRETTTEINGIDTDSDDLQVGTLSIGFFHAFADQFKVDLTTEIGATDEATDVSVILRVPFSFDVF